MTKPTSSQAKRWHTPPPKAGGRHQCDRCDQKGTHLCQPRVDRAVRVFEELLVHTKGKYARAPFILAAWQRDEIIAPIFGWQRWSDEHQRFVRVYRRVWIELARKNGKMLDHATVVPTPSGWTTHGALEVGDKVIGVNGEPTEVIATTGTVTGQPCFRIRFAGGEEVIAGENHLWRVRDNADRTSIQPTRTLYETQTVGGRQDRRWRVYLPAPIELDSAMLPVDPYVLGAWLGDGTTQGAEITSADAEVLSAVAAEYQSTYRYQRGIAETVGHLAMRVDLRAAGVLGDKHIPDDYLRSSKTQRIALLQGLMDTDGSITPPLRGGHTQAEFTSTNERLAHDFHELACTLGINATICEGRATIKGRDCGPKYRVLFSGNQPFPLFRIERKMARQRSYRAGTRSSTRAIEAIEPVESRPCQCIQVAAPDGLYLVGKNMIPTHNSEILAGIALILLAFDDEWGAEIYGAAKDRDQARKVFDVAARMVELSPRLKKTFKVLQREKRIVYEPTGSFYEAIPADAMGNLGHNPHGNVFDEVLTQPNGELWGVLEEGMGTREQPMMVGATTAGNDPVSFAAEMHHEMESILKNPRLDPTTYVYMRNTPKDSDPWQEKNWHFANPALGDFLSLETLRSEADQAQRSLRKQNRFRQFKLNQWVQQLNRWLDLDTWDASAGMVVEKDLEGRTCYGGIDLSSTMDLTALAWIFPPDEYQEIGEDEDGSPILVGEWKCLWRHFTPESNMEALRTRTNYLCDEWARDGWLQVTEGNVVDYDHFMTVVNRDATKFGPIEIGYDPWGPAPVIVQKLQDEGGLKMVPVRQGYATLSAPTKQFEKLLVQKQFHHGGNPVARWQADNVTIRTDPAGNIKPDKERSGDKIDGIAAAITGLDRALRTSGVTRVPLVAWT